jgi:hypothetical protein
MSAPARPLRKSGKVAQTAFSSKRRDGKRRIPTVNQTFADSRIRKRKFLTFRIAAISADKPIASPSRTTGSWRPTMARSAFAGRTTDVETGTAS